MKLKLDDKGAVVVSDGKPVFVSDDGRETAFDYPGTLATISRLNAESKGHRERAETAETSLKAFDGIADPDAARKALTTIRNFDDKKLIDAGEVDKIRTEAISAVEAKYKPIVTERDRLQASLISEMIGGSFSRSKFIGEKLAVPTDMVQATFGRNFEIDDGKVIAKDSNGERIYSRARPGELATFDEALETLVDRYPHRDSILKGTGASGSGAGSNPGITGGKRTITRATFDAMDPSAKASAVKDSVIVD
jgi:hypothetical protein